MGKLEAAFFAFLAVLPALVVAQGVPSEDRPMDAVRRAKNKAPAALNSADVQRGVACLAERDAAALEPMLATAPYSPPERAEADRILTLIQRCLRVNRALTLAQPAVLRGAIAEALYESRFAAAQAARSPALAVAPFLRVEAATANPEAGTLVAMYAMAQCTAARHGEPVRALLAADPGSAAAQAALQALNPAFVSCVTGSGSLNVDGRILRGVLAEAIYRWSLVQRDGPASPFAAPGQ